MQLIYECLKILLNDSIENLKKMDDLQAEMLSVESTIREQYKKAIEERQMLLDCVRRLLCEEK